MPAPQHRARRLQRETGPLAAANLCWGDSSGAMLLTASFKEEDGARVMGGVRGELCVTELRCLSRKG